MRFSQNTPFFKQLQAASAERERPLNRYRIPSPGGVFFFGLARQFMPNQANNINWHAEKINTPIGVNVVEATTKKSFGG